MYTRSVLSAVTLSLVGLASAQLQVISPGGPNLWWVAQSVNNIVWNCQQNTEFSNFTVLVANSNPNILVSPEAIVAVVPNFDCSLQTTVQQVNLQVADGYTVILANPLNSTDVYATSQPFSVKAAGAAYPASSATPTGTGTSSSTSSSPTASPTGATGKNGAGSVRANVGAVIFAGVLGAALF